LLDGYSQTMQVVRPTVRSTRQGGVVVLGTAFHGPDPGTPEPRARQEEIRLLRDRNVCNTTLSPGADSSTSESAVFRSWVVRPEPKPTARLRLFCFPYAGAGASLFLRWPEALPPFVEVCAVQLPGRENRLGESAFSRMHDLVHTLASVLSAHLTTPFVLFGHSLGAFIAFELARRLRDLDLPEPVHLIASGQRAPQVPDSLPAVGHLSDREFILEMVRRYDAIPQVVLESPKMMEVVLPLLRADVLMLETYTYRKAPPLACPITCLGGLGDNESTTDDLVPWREQTTGPFSVEMFPGGHFFMESARESVLRVLSVVAERSLGGGLFGGQ
jgi:medium-chain acyl-[acyl-carrier-protein] hydrolase